MVLSMSQFAFLLYPLGCSEVYPDIPPGPGGKSCFTKFGIGRIRFIMFNSLLQGHN